MRIRTGIVAAALVAVSASAFALVKPEEGWAFPDFDIRGTLQGIALGSSPGQLRERLGPNAPPLVVSAARQSAIDRLRSAAGSDVVVRWNGLTEAPRALFRYQGPLTGADWRDPALVARSFLQDYADLYGLDAAAVDSFQESRRFATKDGTLTILNLQQSVSGIVVFQGDLRFAITPRGEIVSVTSGDPLASVTDLNLTPQVPAAEAVQRAASAIGVELPAPPVRTNPTSERVALFEKGPFAAEPRLEPIVFPMGRAARIGYRVLLARADVPASYEVIVDGQDGRMLHRYNTTKYAQTNGLVFPEHPGAANNVPVNVQFYDDSVLVDPRWPLGWVTSDRSIGNVADAKEDWVSDDEVTIGQRSFDFTPGAPIFFEDTWTNSWASTGNARIDTFFAITNLLYFSNVYHDWLYAYGFDEPSGNWQRDNFGRGGRDNDWVYVDAQDGLNLGRANNANMQSAQDGLNPRAQFYVFNFNGRRDADVDGDVVIHEFTHGLSHRLIGGADSGFCMNGFQAGSMGEGWADFYACAYYDDPVMGEYSTNDPVLGIRGAPYDAYPACHRYTPADFCSANGCGGVAGSACEVHDEGELWAVVLWEMRTLLIAADPANGADITLRIVTDGMKLTACNPTFLDARDGILLADRYAYAGAHQCIIWQAFADRYMGYSATTTSGDDTQPNGVNDLPPFCQTQGSVVLNLDRYACTDSLVVTVHDANASGAPVVQLSASSGDTLNVNLAGTAPTFISNPVPVAVGAAQPNATLEVQPGDTITAAYADSNPPNLAQTTATVNCLARVEPTFTATGGCSTDGGSWPVPIAQILDAGEYVDYTLLVRNREPRDLTNARMTLVGTSDPMVVPITLGAVPVGTILAYSGSGSATFRVGASRFLSSGTVTLDFLLEADGFNGTESALQFTVPVQSDYQIVNGTTGIETFEAGDGGYTHFPWPGSSIDEWQFGICGAASGTQAWHAGPASCTGNAQEQDAVLQSITWNPTTPTRVSWYPTALHWNHRLSLGNGDFAVLWFTEPNFFAGGDYAVVQDYDVASNTGASFAPITLPMTAADTLGGGIQNELGLQAWFDFYSAGAAPPSQEWVVDDVELEYAAADAVPGAVPPTCVEAGYVGTTSGCASTNTASVYNTLRPGEIQFAGSGRFWAQGTDWNLFDVEFPTPTLVGENLVFLVNSNPDDGNHQGVIAVNRKVVTSPAGQSFGAATCAPIPTPVGPASLIAGGQPILLSWTPFVESGTTPTIVGYNVYRIDAELYPATTSTIDEYLASGILVGNTVGNADINRFTDTAPAVASPPEDLYTYVIQPLLRCDGAGCTGPLAATFGGSETIAGKANLSTDSYVSSGGTPVPGPVRVSNALFATFNSWSATRQANGVRVEFSTVQEIDTIAFDVYRGSSADGSGMSSVGRVPAVGGGIYELVDASAPSGSVFYQVREISTGLATRTDVFPVLEPQSGPRGSSSGRRTRAGSSGGTTISTPRGTTRAR